MAEKVRGMAGANGCAGIRRMLKNDVAHGLTVSPPNRDRLTMEVQTVENAQPHPELVEG